MWGLQIRLIDKKETQIYENNYEIEKLNIKIEQYTTDGQLWDNILKYALIGRKFWEDTEGITLKFGAETEL